MVCIPAVNELPSSGFASLKVRNVNPIVNSSAYPDTRSYFDCDQVFKFNKFSLKAVVLGTSVVFKPIVNVGKNNIILFETNLLLTC